MTKSKILHLTRDEKFINAANFLFEKAFPDQNTFLILMSPSESQLKYVTPTANVRIEVVSQKSWQDLLILCEEYDVVVFHGLDALRRQMILNARDKTKRKFFWLFWGSEIYRYGLWDHALLGNKTSLLEKQLSTDHVSLPTPDHIARNKKAIFDLRAIGMQCEEETDFLKENNAIHQETKSLPFAYYPLEFLFSDLDQQISGNNILIGNSASFSNNHIEAIDILTELNLGNRQIYLPLSYGNKEYGDHIANYAEEKFPHRVVAMRDFLPLHEYNRLISSCGIVVMNHYRQQAFGNILAFVYLGAKVFLNETTIYKYLKRIGCYVFSIENDLKDNKNDTLEPLSAEEIHHNREILSKEISTEAIVKKLHDSVSLHFNLDNQRTTPNSPNETPIVDVLMPVYNTALFLSEAIESVLDQSLANFRLIILDDGSTDSSWQIIQRYAEKDQRILAVRQENQGTLKARDKLVSLATAEFVSWVDSDDVINPTRLEKHLAFLKKNPSFAAVSSDLGYIHSKRVDFTPRNPEEIKVRTIFEWVIKDPGTIRRSVFDRYSLRFAESGLESAEDGWFWSELAAKEPIGAIAEVLYSYRQHSAQESQRNLTRQRQAHQEIIRRQLAKFEIDCSDIEDKTALYPNLKSTYSTKSVAQAGRIFLKLLEKNRSLQLYPHQTLDTYLTNSYRGLCRRIGPWGVIQYIRVMGLRKLLKGHHFGCKFIWDCFFRNQ